MDSEFGDELTALMPVVPHNTVAAECSGYITASVEDGHVELRCNKCWAVVGVVQVGIMEGLLGLDCDHAVCPYCKQVNTVPQLDRMADFVCERCGRTVGT